MWNVSDTHNNEWTGTISESLRKYLVNIWGEHKIKELQQTALVGTAHVLQKAKVWNGTGSNIARTVSCNCRIAATLCTLRDMVCFWNSL